VADAGGAQAGRIHADGQQGTANAGGGTGGSIWVSSPSITIGISPGADTFSAQGAAANGSGGAGGDGRIRLDETANDAGSLALLSGSATPLAQLGVAGPLVGQSVDEYDLTSTQITNAVAIRAADLLLSLGTAPGASYFAAASSNDPPDFGALPAVGTPLDFVSKGSPAQGSRFRWKAQLSPLPGAPQTLLGLQWLLTVN
jgi:hypothetical protein